MTVGLTVLVYEAGPEPGSLLEPVAGMLLPLVRGCRKGIATAFEAGVYVWL